jgi:hypothetical protein
VRDCANYFSRRDVCGVRGIPEAEDEYDAYVGKVYVMHMDEQATEAAIKDYLYNVAVHHMGLSPSDGIRQACEETAKAVIGLRPQFQLQ